MLIKPYELFLGIIAIIIGLIIGLTITANFINIV